MADTKKPAASTEQGRRNTKIGYVVSTKMNKTIVVKVDMLKRIRSIAAPSSARRNSMQHDGGLDERTASPTWPLS